MSKYYNYGDAQYRASQKYEKENIKRVVVKLNKNTDSDLIEYVDALDNMQGKIKEVMRNDMIAEGLIVYVTEMINDQMRIEYRSKKYHEAYDESEDAFDEVNKEIYFIKNNDLSDELKKIAEYEGVEALNVIYKL